MTAVVAKINLASCVHNCEVLRRAAGKRQMFAVVKADAYGHGLEPVTRSIKAHVDGLCVFESKDGKLLREVAVDLPIVVLGGLRNNDDVSLVIRNRLWPVVHCWHDIELLRNSSELPERIFIKVQTGMHRLGFAIDEVATVQQTLERLGKTRLALMHHYAKAEVSGGTQAQDKVMRELVNRCRLAITSSNSAATLLGNGSDEEFVRCGIGVYGAVPGGASMTAASLGLRPAMTLCSEVMAIQEVAQGQRVGYGLRWQASSATRIAVVACGYAHGYPRSVPDGTAVWIKNRRFFIAGRVSMEMLTVEIGDASIQIGDEVELWGNNIPVDEVANSCGTIAYELLASLTQRIPRQYCEL